MSRKPRRPGRAPSAKARKRLADLKVKPKQAAGVRGGVTAKCTCTFVTTRGGPSLKVNPSCPIHGAG